MGCAVITGGSRGIGRAVAISLAKQGYDILIGYHGNDAAAMAVISEIESLGVKVQSFKGDISDEQTARDMVQKAVDSFGSIEVLVNNAGITRDTLLLRMKTEDFKAVLDTNLTAAFNMTREAAKYMAKARSGRIVNISSVVGEIGNAGQCNYAASKAGLIGMTKSAAKELAARRITVNAVAPGFIETDMTDALKDEMKAEILKNIPLGRFGNAEDVAAAVEFLVSERADYITGQVINVCGGMVM